MPAARVVLFDLFTGGHHIKYVSYLTQYLLERDYEVAFMTFKEGRGVSLLPKHPRLRIEYLSPDSDARIGKGHLGLIKAVSRGLGRCYAFSAQWGADIVCVMYLDYAELPLLFRTLTWRRRCWRQLGFLIWPYFQRSRRERVKLHKRIYRNIRRWALRALLHRGLLDAVFVHSEHAKETLDGRGVSSYPKDRRVVVPDPCDDFRGICSTQEARARLGLPREACILLFFGGLRWDKGIDILLEAVEDMKDDFVLVVAGEGEYISATQLEVWRKRFAYPEKVIARVEYIGEEEAKYYFLAADAVVLPYRAVFRGTSGILQNAAAAGKPVIASDVGEIGRLVRQYSLGILVEPESKEALMEGIRTFIAGRNRLATAVRENVANYVTAHHWERMAELVEGTFRAVLGEHRDVLYSGKS